MARPVKTEGIVLRSLRYGEADRILHVYTRDRGRMEPFSQVALILHEGRSDLLTVTGADTVDSHARLRDDAAALDSAARACDAVGRLFETDDPHPEVFNLLGNELALLAGDHALATHANQLAFRLKLLLAAGFAPHLTTCAS